MRVVTENLDDSGKVVSTSTTETTTTLMAVDEQSYTLRVEVTVEVAGKRFTAVPKTVRKTFDGEDEGQPVVLQKLRPGTIVVNGETFASQVSRLEVDVGDTKRITTVYYSDEVEPYVLKRESTATDSTGQVVNVISEVDVLAIEMPYQVLSEMKTAAVTKTVHQWPKGKTVTLEVQTFEVPGGVVAHTSKEMDATGKVVRRSTLELVDYGIVQGEKRPVRRWFWDRLRHRSNPQ